MKASTMYSKSTFHRKPWLLSSPFHPADYWPRCIRLASRVAAICPSDAGIAPVYICSFCLCALELLVSAPTLPKQRLHLSSPTPSPSLLPSCHWCLRQSLNTPSGPPLSISTLHPPPTPCPPPQLPSSDYLWVSLWADREHGWLTRQVMSLLMQMASPAPLDSLPLSRPLFFTSLSLSHTNTHRGAKEPTPPDCTSTPPPLRPPPFPFGVLRYSWVKQYLKMFGGR